MSGVASGRIGPGLGVAGAVWLVALVAVIVVALAAGFGVAAHGYFAGWLVAISLPLGALPVLMVQDLLGATETPTRAALRLLVAALPIVAVLIVPVLFDLGGIFPWPAGSQLAPASAEPLKGFARSWYTSGAFGVRAIVYLVVWCALALFFVRPASPSPRHRTVAGLGLAIHAVLGTLAAYDWWMSLDMSFNSSVYGVVVVSAQASLALAVAALIGAAEGVAPERSTVMALLAVLFLAAFAQFAQYLVVWSANLPKEIVWYQSRWTGALGPVFVIGLPVLLALVFALLIPAAISATRAPAIVALAATVLVAFLDLACLASPRGTFTFGGVALVLAFLIVVGGLGAVCATLLGGRVAMEAHRG